MKKCIYNRSAKNLPSKVLFTGKRWRQYHRLFARQNCNRWQQWKSENVSFLSSNISLFLVHSKIKKYIYLASSRLGKYHPPQDTDTVVNNCFIYFEGIGMPFFGSFSIYYLLHIYPEFPLPGISAWLIFSKSSNGSFDTSFDSSMGSSSFCFSPGSVTNSMLRGASATSTWGCRSLCTPVRFLLEKFSSASVPLRFTPISLLSRHSTSYVERWDKP